MISELPRSAFHLFIALRPPPSLHIVAQALDVSVELVERVAKRERWSERAQRIEGYARLHASGGRKGPVRADLVGPLKMAKQLQRLGLRHLRHYPLLTALECVDQNEAEMRATRSGSPSVAAERELLDLNDEMRGMLLADRRRHGTPDLGEKGLV